MSSDVLFEYLVRIRPKDAKAFANATEQFDKAVRVLSKNSDLWEQRR